MCVFGRICVRSPLPSLVTMIEVPVSAMRKFAPVMPTSAARKLSRSTAARLAKKLHRLGEIAAAVELRVRAAKIRLDLGRVEVHRRGDDVARHLVPELDDVLAEIGLDRRDAVAFEVVVEADLLGDHRLALGHGPRPRGPADAEDDVPRLRRIAGEMHLPAGRRDLLLVALEVEVEMGERMVLDVPRRIPQRLELRQPPDRALPPVDEPPLDVPQRPLELPVGKGRGGVLLEGGGGGVGGHREGFSADGGGGGGES